MNEEELTKLESVLVKAEGDLRNSAWYREDRLSRMRVFAGNDTRILDRIPMVRALALKEKHTAMKVAELLAEVRQLQEAQKSL